MKKNNKSIPWISYVSAVFAVGSIFLWEFSIVPILAIVIGTIALFVDEKKSKAITSIAFGVIFLIVRVANGQLNHSFSFQNIFTTNNTQEVSNSEIAQEIFTCPEDSGTNISDAGFLQKFVNHYKATHINPSKEDMLKDLWNKLEDHECYSSLYYLSTNGDIPAGYERPNSSFKCPESYTDDNVLEQDSKKIMDDYMASNPNATVQDYTDFRYRMLKINHCYKTLLNIKINNKLN